MKRVRTIDGFAVLMKMQQRILNPVLERKGIKEVMKERKKERKKEEERKRDEGTFALKDSLPFLQLN